MRAAVVALLLAASVAHAQEPPNEAFNYRVKQGDTLELLAAEMYGDRGKVVLLVVENKLQRARPLKPGERLRIPITREIVTSPGETFESLAGSQLGSPRRAPFLAEANGLSSEDGLPAGTQLTIPIAITHTAMATEALTDIARMYLGDPRQAETLRRYNFLDKRSIERNETLIVPMLRLRLAPGKLPPLDPDAKARRDRRRDAVARVARALPAARQAWRDADYAAVTSTLSPVEADLDFLDAADAVDTGVLLGAARIADNHNDAALEIFKRVLDRQAHHVLRRYDFSPKIISVWQSAGGQVE